jgi:hypothetical protein
MNYDRPGSVVFIIVALLAFVVGVALIYAGVRVVQSGDDSHVAAFRIYGMNSIPIAVPVGIFKFRCFWGGMLIVIGAYVVSYGAGTLSALRKLRQ